MPRYNLSHYGWIVILILILSLLISLATPFGEYVYTTTEHMTNVFLDITYKALKLDSPILGGEECFYADDYGTLRIRHAYTETYVPRLYHEIAEENHMSVRNLCKAYVYGMFVSGNLTNDSILNYNVSNKQLEEGIGAYFAEELGLKDDIDNALIQYPHMKTRRQVMINYLYLEFVQNFYSVVPGGLSYDGRNVTLSDLDDLASKIAMALHDDALSEVKAQYPDIDDIDKIIYRLLFEMVLGQEHIAQYVDNPKDAKDIFASFGASTVAFDIYGNLFTALLKTPEKAKANDLLLLLSDEYAIHGIDMLLNLAEENPRYDYDRALLFVPYIGGYTISEVEKYGDKFKLPHKFNISESYYGITVTSIPNELFYDFGDYYDNIEAVHLPSTIKSIGNQAFMSCDNLKQINLENVSILGEECFRYTALTHIELSPELKVVPNGAFEYTPLRYVKINHGTETIEVNAFGSCNQLELIYIPNSVTSISLPNNSRLIVYTPIDSPAEKYAKDGKIAFVNATSVPDYYEILRK